MDDSPVYGGSVDGNGDVLGTGQGLDGAGGFGGEPGGLLFASGASSAGLIDPLAKQHATFEGNLVTVQAGGRDLTVEPSQRARPKGSPTACAKLSAAKLRALLGGPAEKVSARAYGGPSSVYTYLGSGSKRRLKIVLNPESASERAAFIASAAAEHFRPSEIHGDTAVTMRTSSDDLDLYVLGRGTVAGFHLISLDGLPTERALTVLAASATGLLHSL